MANEANGKSERKSGLAIAGLVVAIFALLGSWVPIINNVSFFVAIVALALGIAGFVSIKKGKRTGQGLAITTIILALVSGGVVLGSQAFYGKVANDVGKSINETANDYNGNNTEKLLKESVDVTLGQFTVKEGDYTTDTELPVAVKNKSSEKASFTIKIEAVDASGVRLADDTVYVTDLNAGQSAAEKAFTFVPSDKVEALKTATFKVLEVSK